MSFKPGQKVKYIGQSENCVKKGAIATVIKSPGSSTLPENRWPVHTRDKIGGGLRRRIFEEVWLYIIWDESNPNWNGMGHGGFFPDNFEPADNGEMLSFAEDINRKRCICGGPAKKVPCGIGPAAQVIEICSICGEEK